MPGSGGLEGGRSGYFKSNNPAPLLNLRRPLPVTNYSSEESTESTESTGGSSEEASTDETTSSETSCSAGGADFLARELERVGLEEAGGWSSHLLPVPSTGGGGGGGGLAEVETGGTTKTSPCSGGSGGSSSPYSLLLRSLETEGKWRAERSAGRLVGLYKICGEIGAGNFAKVRLGIHTLLKERVAVKIIDLSRVEPKLERMLSREISCMETLYHPNIVRLYEVIETRRQLYLISEWASAGDLYSKVTLRSRLTEAEAQPIFKQILSALTFMHWNGIVHRDLKAENIFFASATHCKVGDFGFATTAVKGQMLSTFCGSPPYAAPELFRDESYEGGMVDIWALGVLLYFMIQGHLPFVGTSIPALKKAILEGEYHVSPTVSSDCLDLIQGILQQRPFARLTISRIIRHPWLQEACAQPQQRTSSVEKSPSSSSELEERPKATSSSFDEGTVQHHHQLLRRQDTTAILLPATRNRALSKTIPTREQLLYGLLSPPELKALQILKELGISDKVIEAHRAGGVKSHVIGIYRILLHQLQEGRGVKELYFNGPSPTHQVRLLGLQVPSSGGGGGGSFIRGQHSPSALKAPPLPLRKQCALPSSYDEQSVSQSTTCSIL